MSQQELAKKYGENRSTIAAAMIRAGVAPATKSENRYPVNLYREEDAVDALVAMYNESAELHIRRAEKWIQQIEKVSMRYQDGLGREA